MGSSKLKESRRECSRTTEEVIGIFHERGEICVVQPSVQYSLSPLSQYPTLLGREMATYVRPSANRRRRCWIQRTERRWQCLGPYEWKWYMMAPSEGRWHLTTKDIFHSAKCAIEEPSFGPYILHQHDTVVLRLPVHVFLTMKSMLIAMDLTKQSMRMEISYVLVMVFRIYSAEVWNPRAAGATLWGHLHTYEFIDLCSFGQSDHQMGYLPSVTPLLLEFDENTRKAENIGLTVRGSWDE